MKRSGIVGAAVAAMLTALTAGAARADADAMRQAQTLYTQLRDTAQCPAALPVARTFAASAPFSALPAAVRETLLYEIMSCAWSQEDGEAAAAATRAARDAGASWADYVLLQIGVRFQLDAAAVEGLHALSASDPAQFDTLPARFVWGALRAARRLDPGGDEALRVHEALAARNYAFPDNDADDSLRVDHARLLTARGEVARARARLETVIDPRLILTLRIDRTFDPLRGDAGFERRLDVAAAAEASLARARAEAARDPRKLSRVLALAQALRTLGRNEEALAVLDQAITKAQGAGGAASFDDTPQYLNWILNEKAYVLYDLNRPNEARNVFGESIAVGEEGEPSVSQVINFASMLAAEGRAADAIQVVSTVGEASPYGDMWVASVRACAAQQIGDAALRDEAMAFLRSHEDDNVAALARALLCVNDIDAAAALYIRRLGDPAERAGALIALQTYRRTPRPALPQEQTLYERLEQVRARADVRAAVEAVGRIEEVPLRSVYWGDV